MINFNGIKHIPNKSWHVNGCGKNFLHAFFEAIKLGYNKNFTSLMSATSYTSDYNGLKMDLQAGSNNTADDFISAVHGKISN